MRDEQVGEAQLALQVVHQVEHLGLDGHVVGGHRLVGHDQVGRQHQRPREAKPLPLAAAGLRARAEKIAEGNWASQAVRKAIEEMMAAVLTATTAATIATTASAG